MDKLDINKFLANTFSKKIEQLDLELLFKEKAKSYGLNFTQARELLNIERKVLIPILNGTAQNPSPVNLLKISDFLEIDIKTVLASLVKSSESVSKLEQARDASFVAKNFDVDRLYSEGFLSSKKDTEKILDRILNFFGFTSVVEYLEFKDKINLVLYSKSKRNFVDKMRNFSVESAYRIFELISNPNQYKREELIELLPKIKPYCQDIEKGLYTVCRALFSHGITVIFQKHLTTSQYRGATFFVNGKPCIVITDLRKNYVTIWFALLHELYHVLFDEEEIKREGYHLTGEVQLTLVDEKAADSFASDFFVDDAEFRYIKPHIKSNLLVNNFAKKIRVHPAFIYSKFQFYMQDVENKIYWGAFNQYFPDYKKAVSKLNPISWREDYSILSIVEDLKQIFEIQINEKN